MKGGKSLSELFPAGAEEGSEGAYRFNTETKPEAVVTGDFNASTMSIPQLGTSAAALKAIFDSQAAGPLPEVYEVGDGYAVLQVTSRARPSDAEFASQKDQMK